MQPTFLPWPGYFNLIESVDIFIFLENVKFEKSSWHQRNLFLINSKSSYITIPVTGSRLQLIKDVKINYTNIWQKKFTLSLINNYKKHPFGMEILNIIIPVLESSKFILLKELNIELIKKITNYLGIKVNFSSDKNLESNSKKSMRLIEICKLYNVSEYYSPLGSKDYIQEEKLFSKFDIKVKYQNPQLVPYNQYNSGEFIPYLSVVDLISNLGKTESLKYIKKNFKN